MPTVKTLLSAKTLDDVCSLIAEYTEVMMTTDQVAGLLQIDDRVVYDIAKWGADDTEVRSKIASMVSDHFIGKRWPTYGTKVDVGAFVAEIREAAVLRGYSVSDGNSTHG